MSRSSGRVAFRVLSFRRNDTTPSSHMLPTTQPPPWRRTECGKGPRVIIAFFPPRAEQRTPLSFGYTIQLGRVRNLCQAKLLEPSFHFTQCTLRPPENTHTYRERFTSERGASDTRARTLSLSLFRDRQIGWGVRYVRLCHVRMKTYSRQMFFSQLYFLASAMRLGSIMPPRRRSTKWSVDSFWML